MEKILELTIELVVLALSFVIGKYVIPYINDKISANNLEQIRTWTMTFVKCAESIITEKKAGNVKYEYVVQLLKTKLAEYDISMDEDTIRSIIEECVFNMNQSKAE